MFYEDDERDAFEAFGDQAETEENAEFSPPEESRVIEPAPQSGVKTGFSWAGFVGGLGALTWVGAAIGGPLSYFGIDAVLTMDPAMQAGMVALAFGPALLFWVSASAAGEALKARRLATELTRLAHEARLPIEANENDARRLSHIVKAEIETLNDAVSTALDRLAELEQRAQRNAALFRDAVACSHESAEAMTNTLSREREAIVELNGEMRGDTEAMALSIARQVRLMREASSLVKTQMNAAEDALDGHLASFSASAATLGEHTAAFSDAADGAQAAANALNGKVASMLDGLGEATRLSDAARQSAEQAVIAANETAQSVRETTRSAVTEAKRAAQLIREETAALQGAAAETLAKLTDAAHAAREASEQSQIAADRHAAAIEKRLAALAATVAAKKAAPATQRAAERPIDRTAERMSAEPEIATLKAAANAASSRWAPRQRQTVRVEAPARPAFKGFTGWTNFLAQAPSRDELPKPANEASAYDLVDFGASNSDPDAYLKNDTIDLIAAAGIDLDEVLRARDLERIAQSSRHGASARRRAVADAAPGAVDRISRHVKRNAAARTIATEFRARPDLAKAGKEGSELVRAYLLIDAALA